MHTGRHGTEQVERETDTPPLDLYLNKRIAEFEARLEASGMAQLIRDSNAAITNTLRQRTLNRRKNLPKFKEARSGTARAEWARRWVGDGATHEALQRDWQVRWEAIQRRRETATKTERGIHPLEAAEDPRFEKDPLKLHKGLLKHESALLVQMRTGKIGLAAFLFQCKVPGVMTPRCNCGSGAPEKPIHVVLDCSKYHEERRALAAP